MSKHEDILVVKRDTLFRNETRKFQGLETDSRKQGEILSTIDHHFEIMVRSEAEEDPTYKQPIPYVIIRQGKRFFLYERLKGSGESRLHHQLSLGFGGHMNPIAGETSFPSLLRENLERELEEELYIESKRNTLTPIGLINDDENKVGRVHIGLLYIMDLDDSATVSIRETEKLKGEWVDLRTLKNPQIVDRLETWSQIAAPILNDA